MISHALYITRVLHYLYNLHSTVKYETTYEYVPLCTALHIIRVLHSFEFNDNPHSEINNKLYSPSALCFSFYRNSPLKSKQGYYCCYYLLLLATTSVSQAPVSPCVYIYLSQMHAPSRNKLHTIHVYKYVCPCIRQQRSINKFD